MESLGKQVYIKPFELTGVIRGYDPHNQKLWVVLNKKGQWFSKVELEFL